MTDTIKQFMSAFIVLYVLYLIVAGTLALLFLIARGIISLFRKEPVEQPVVKELPPEPKKVELRVVMPGDPMFDIVYHELVK